MPSRISSITDKSTSNNSTTFSMLNNLKHFVYNWIKDKCLHMCKIDKNNTAEEKNQQPQEEMEKNIDFILIT